MEDPLVPVNEEDESTENRSRFLDARLRFSGNGSLDVEVLGRGVDASVSGFELVGAFGGKRMSHSWFVGPWWFFWHCGVEGGIENIRLFQLSDKAKSTFVSQSFARQSSHIVTYGHLDPNPIHQKNEAKDCRRPLAELS